MNSRGQQENKALAMLCRWVKLKKEIRLGNRDLRPKNIFEISSITTCERWRRELINDIVKKFTDVHNASLGEYKIREANDELNKMIEEKKQWEDRIKQLGGKDYSEINPMVIESDGIELPGSSGYKYFGVAKELPKVRDLLLKDPPAPPRKSRKELYKRITYEYYGYMDNNDEEMLNEEKKVEEEERKKILEKQAKDSIEEEEVILSSKQKKKKLNSGEAQKMEKINKEKQNKDEIELEELKSIQDSVKAIETSVEKKQLTDEELKKAFIQKRKQILIQRFGNEENIKDEKDSKPSFKNIDI